MTSIPLNKATHIAEVVAAGIAEYCDRVAIAGSIRRRRPFCNDIDLVVLPKPGQLLALQARFKARCKAIKEGEQNAMYETLNGIQLDVFFAHGPTTDMFNPQPGNFGTLLLCRTGSKEHNIYLIEHAKRQNLTWNPYHGVFARMTRRCLAAEDEADIFTALGLPFIPPESRER